MENLIWENLIRMGDLQRLEEQLAPGAGPYWSWACFLWRKPAPQPRLRDVRRCGKFKALPSEPDAMASSAIHSLRGMDLVG